MHSTTVSDRAIADSNTATDLQYQIVGVIYFRLNYLTIGSIIALTQKYVDKVYVITNGDDPRISSLSRSLGAEVIEKSETPYVKIFRKLVTENNSNIFVAMYGDGSHDPEIIPELVNGIEGGFDVVVGPNSHEYGRDINETILYLNNKMPRAEHPAIIACKNDCFDRIKADFMFNVSSDISAQFASKLETVGLKVKYLESSPDGGHNLFSLYKIAVVVPAYNEEALIGETIAGVPKYVHRAYVIDDGSKDRTWEIINSYKDPRIVPIKHEANKGVGAAIVTGYKRALDDGMDIVAVMAGDHQMDPEQLPRLLMPIIEGRADYTKGNRLISKDFRKGMSKWRSFGNFILTMLTKIGSGYWHIMDPQNGYTAISRQALEALDLDAVYPYYGYCNDLLVKLNAYGMRTVDVVMPSRYGQERSKIKYSRYIVKVSPMLFRGFLWRLKTKYIMLDFNPLVLFYAVSMVMVPFGFLFCLWILIEKILSHPVSNNYPLLAVFITLMGVQFLMFAMLFDMQADKSRNIM